MAAETQVGQSRQTPVWGPEGSSASQGLFIDGAMFLLPARRHRPARAEGHRVLRQRQEEQTRVAGRADGGHQEGSATDRRGLVQTSTLSLKETRFKYKTLNERP